MVKVVEMPQMRFELIGISSEGWHHPLPALANRIG